MPAQTILSGFVDPVHDAGRAFRAVLEGMSHPGRIVQLHGPAETPQGMHGATAAIALTLFDNETPVRLEGFGADTTAWLQFHCGCNITASASQAMFAISRNGTPLPDLLSFSIGTEAYPDRAATLVIQVATFGTGDMVRLEGPGIKGEHRFSVSGLDRTFWSIFTQNRTLFPLGFDVILTTPGSLVCLPRTVIARGPLACM